MMIDRFARIRPTRMPWAGWSLATRFAVAGGIVMVLAALVVGYIVSNRIREVVVRNSANATALYMESFISPLSQELAEADALSPGAKRALEEMLTETTLGERVASFKIWKADGLLVHASNSDIVGQRFSLTDNLRLAFDGNVRADFEDLQDPEDVKEGALGVPLLEIYSPIREVWSGRVIAVAEFYERAEGLKVDLALARRNSWATVALVMAVIGGSLYAIVLGGSRTIDRQLVTLKEMSQRNSDLRLRVQSAAGRFSALNDQALRRVGADLHDGPAQLLAFMALRLDSLRKSVSAPEGLAEIDAVEHAAREALHDIRAIARGLSLPEIERRPVADLVASAVSAHRGRTASDVVLVSTVAADVILPAAINICAYRFVQEGLTNAFKHAGGLGQEVRLSLDKDGLRLAVLDRGPGLPDRTEKTHATGEDSMGLSGLRDRVESLGGQFDIRNRDPHGVEMTMFVEARV